MVSRSQICPEGSRSQRAGGRRADPGLLVLDASRPEAERRTEKMSESLPGRPFGLKGIIYSRIFFKSTFQKVLGAIRALKKPPKYRRLRRRSPLRSKHASSKSSPSCRRQRQGSLR